MGADALADAVALDGEPEYLGGLEDLWVDVEAERHRIREDQEARGLTDAQRLAELERLVAA